MNTLQHQQASRSSTEAERVAADKADVQCAYLILGGGIAGVTAAEAIRQRDGHGDIILLSAEEELPINRPLLTKDFAGLADGTAVTHIHDAAWYEARRIDLRLGVAGERLLPEDKAVLASDGRTYRYDKLIYAAGAECAVPPIPGSQLDGVATIRHLEDSLRVHEHIRKGMPVVVIGGGVLGIEAASELARAGAEVTVLEAAAQIMGRQIDPDTAAVLRRRMARRGVKCLEGVQVAAIEGDGRASGVRLADDRLFPAEMVVLSCGNRANMDVAQAAGAAADRAIQVDCHMRTSLRDVYACGDCAALDGVNMQQWSEAFEQGKVAGANAAGADVCLAAGPVGLHMNAFDMSLYAVGCFGTPEEPMEAVRLTDEVTGRRETYWFRQGRMQGAVLVDAIWRVDWATKAVAAHAKHDDCFGETAQ